MFLGLQHCPQLVLLLLVAVEGQELSVQLHEDLYVHLSRGPLGREAAVQEVVDLGVEVVEFARVGQEEGVQLLDAGEQLLLLDLSPALRLSELVHLVPTHLDILGGVGVGVGDVGDQQVEVLGQEDQVVQPFLERQQYSPYHIYYIALKYQR